AIFDRYVLALDVADLFEALAKRAQFPVKSSDAPPRTPTTGIAGCCACAASGQAAAAPPTAAKNFRPRHRRLLLRARRERPSRRSAAEQRDEAAPPHSGHGDFLPYAVSAPPTGPCARFSGTISLP